MAKTLAQQLADIAKNYTNSSGNNLTNGKNMKSILRQEGKKLYNLVQEEIDNYYNSYRPEQYVRSYRLKQALRIDSVKDEGGSLSIRIYFDRGLTIHPSIFNDDDVGDAALLINYGWDIKSPNVPDYYRLKNFIGDGFINRAIKRYNSSNTYGIKINVHSEWDGQVIEDSYY